MGRADGWGRERGCVWCHGRQEVTAVEADRQAAVAPASVEAGAERIPIGSIAGSGGGAYPQHASR